jgi:hypothetical protein
MDASREVAKYFDSLIERCNRDPSGRPKNLPKHDQIIFYVISTRCEMDMNGFESVFDQMLDEDELVLLIGALQELEVPELAQSFEKAHARLRAAGFFDDDSMMVSDLDNGGEGFLEDIEEEIRNHDPLWLLDDRLAELIPKDAK